MDAGTQKPQPHDPPSLALLRSRVDALDHELLQLLARRGGLVAEIARAKRLEGVPIRDRARESEIISDRRAVAERLGLNPDVVESIYRNVLWASRDRQASLRAELADDEPRKTIAVVGGLGAMGRCISGLFADLGHAVLVADVSTALRPEQAAAAADVTIISVPIAATVEVIRAVGPHVPAHGLLMDVTSLKAEPLRAMLDYCPASVLGTHPLFGPSVHSLQGQRIALTPGRGDEWLAWVRRALRARGLIAIETTAERHDRTMGVVQVLNHLSTQVMGRALSLTGMPLADTLAFASPAYLMELTMTGRHFAQSPGLYAAIEMGNPDMPQMTAAFRAAAAEVISLVERRDAAGFAAMFEQVQRYFGEFTRQALEQSNFLIDRLVERSD
ncbi:MAG: bifunctional chorismate mutase/prephenate dehydrogenase [Phycisphaerae bacterium]|nr:bifunctional chorismate mutase/prephenate dehydrogenase [Phycisphaerae bacterium]MCZ2398916.1 bifunctional chorismate mutase/prephenate dehydrogenase [Phycisphaerae bacterium]